MGLTNSTVPSTQGNRHRAVRQDHISKRGERLYSNERSQDQEYQQYYDYGVPTYTGQAYTDTSDSATWISNASRWSLERLRDLGVRIYDWWTQEIPTDDEARTSRSHTDSANREEDTTPKVFSDSSIREEETNLKVLSDSNEYEEETYIKGLLDSQDDEEETQPKGFWDNDFIPGRLGPEGNSNPSSVTLRGRNSDATDIDSDEDTQPKII